MISRRRFVTLSGGTLAVSFSSGVFPVMAQGNPQSQNTWSMPDESAPHRCTWMAFGADEEIWDDLIDDVRKNLATVAKTIAQYEPV